jgi:branched-chain amino acid aminotransferase
MSLVWLNGTLADKLDTRISPFDHGLLYGDGVWEHLRLYNGKPFRGAQVMQQLRAAADAIGLEIPLSADELLAAIDATAKANARTEGYVRVIVTRGPGGIGPDPRKIEPQVIVIAEEYQPFPQELYGHGLHAVVAPSKLDADNATHRHRTLGQLHVVEAKRHALRNGCLEALFQNRAGEVVGATEGVVFAVTGGNIDVAAGYPWDEVASAVSELAETELDLTQRDLHPHHLLAADEVFIAGTACGVIGVVSIDGRAIGSGSEGRETRELRQRFTHLTRTETA